MIENKNHEILSFTKDDDRDNGHTFMIGQNFLFSGLHKCLPS